MSKQKWIVDEENVVEIGTYGLKTNALPYYHPIHREARDIAPSFQLTKGFEILQGSFPG